MYNYICLLWSVKLMSFTYPTCISIHKYASTFTCLYLSLHIYLRFIIITCVLFRPLLKQKSWHLMELTIDTNETVDMTNAILDSSLARWQLMLCDSPPNIKCVKPNHSFDSLSLSSHCETKSTCLPTRYTKETFIILHIITTTTIPPPPHVSCLLPWLKLTKTVR